MLISEAFPSKYLKAADIPEGRRVTVTISNVEMELVSKTDKRPVVYFQGKQKGMVLNKTNSKMITRIAKSDDTDAWVGVVIALYSTDVEYAGDIVPALRVAAPVQANGAKPLAKPNTPPATDFDDDSRDFPPPLDDDQIPWK